MIAIGLSSEVKSLVEEFLISYNEWENSEPKFLVKPSAHTPAAIAQSNKIEKWRLSEPKVLDKLGSVENLIELLLYLGVQYWEYSKHDELRKIHKTFINYLAWMAQKPKLYENGSGDPNSMEALANEALLARWEKKSPELRLSNDDVMAAIGYSGRFTAFIDKLHEPLRSEA